MAIAFTLAFIYFAIFFTIVLVSSFDPEGRLHWKYAVFWPFYIRYLLKNTHFF